MGIVFIISLIVVVCSFLLIVINFKWNINLVREYLISYLEDYFDNIL